MQNSMVIFTFSAFDRKYPFWENLVQKVKMVSLSWILIPRFQLEIPFSNKFSPVNQNCLCWNLVLKLIRIWRIQWWCSLFSVFDQKYPFLGKFVPKVKIIYSGWTLEPSLIRICRIRCWFSFLLLFLDRKYPFWVDLVQKFKIFSLSWNLVARLFRICMKL